MSDSKALEAMIAQGFDQLREGRFEDAIETFSAAHALDTSDDRSLRGRGLAYIRLGQSLSAEIDFRAARDLNNKEPENWMGLGVSLAMQNKIYDAIRVYEDFLLMNPNHLQTHIQLGRLQFKLGVIARGRDHFRKALGLRPNLEQRRMMEATLKEQDKLDQNRYYRPDFERLRKQNSAFAESLGRLLSIFKKKDNAARGMPG